MAKCPFCEKPITLKASKGNANTIRKEKIGLIKKETMYFCPHCEKVLGFAFFFGGALLGRP